MQKLCFSTMIVIYFLVCLSSAVLADWGSDRVRLTDVSTITLYQGRMTQGRRSAPVPQLKCIGGTAGCKAFVPKVVQCYNKGSDGFDVHWRCDTDMDNAYRFGHITVSCEGYSYPDDPYILRGSCGLEYTIDLTREGEQANRGAHYYHPESRHYFHDSQSQSSWSWIGNVVSLIFYSIIVVFVVGFCFLCCQSLSSGNYQSFAYPYPSYSASTSNNSGFWTGAATGGFLGYMFGRRNTGNDTPAYHSGGFYTSGQCSSSPNPDRSSGTRTASGYGGTTRR